MGPARRHPPSSSSRSLPLADACPDAACVFVELTELMIVVELEVELEVGTGVEEVGMGNEVKVARP